MSTAVKGQKAYFACSFLGKAKFLNAPDPETPFMIFAGTKFTSPLRSTISDAIVGMSVNETKQMIIEPKDAFGEHDPYKVLSMKIKDSRIYQEGDCISLKKSHTNGTKVEQGIVSKVRIDKVDVDTNHPLAGQTLTMNLKLLAFKN